MPISVCMLVLNEADRLVRSLSPLGIFEEVLVLDSGSTDGSQKLCREAGAQVLEQAWKGFGETRKRLFEEAEQPWILWIDADEVVTETLAAELHALFEKGPSCAAYEVNRMVCFEGQWVRHGEWFPDWNVRLFRREAWEMLPRAVHEAVKINGRVGHLQGLLEHHSYRDWDDQRRRSERYARLWAEQNAGRKIGPLAGPSRALWRFFKGYVLKRGFLDGRLGFRIAVANAREVARKYALARAAAAAEH